MSAQARPTVHGKLGHVTGAWSPQRELLYSSTMGEASTLTKVLSTATTLTLVAPSTPSTVGNDDDETGDIYAAALQKLQSKVPAVITEEEYREFQNDLVANDCNSYTKAKKRLESLRSDEKYQNKFHAFFAAVYRCLEPLRLFQKALDVLCQAEPTGTFTLVWGSLRLLMEVRQVPLTSRLA
ncbi:hypothetical protein QBC43DRAFT_69327 [Cladorrhinum sp. PSN259]|nr:hypothetical protein QBC43DRAFT_69327 [Cladorrhinum sp. PSN259]